MRGGEDQFRFFHGRFDYVNGYVNDGYCSGIIDLVWGIAWPMVFGMASRMEKQHGDILSVERRLVGSAAAVMSAMDAQAARVDTVEYAGPRRTRAIPDDGQLLVIAADHIKVEHEVQVLQWQGRLLYEVPRAEQT